MSLHLLLSLPSLRLSSYGASVLNRLTNDDGAEKQEESGKSSSEAHDDAEQKASCTTIRYNVSYPAMYASISERKDAKLFNCSQKVFPAQESGKRLFAIRKGLNLALKLKLDRIVMESEAEAIVKNVLYFDRITSHRCSCSDSRLQGS
ncbi:hypothetical protein RHGRI_029351 [Rhododendron griersonianum]|uniref:RNase H type-1 domain-containing protein n=1 Tax=Rhododendron griersonianum TaxID=479676 RepID=A0AAV6ILA2_9ERIC|nr:hypothetical protein RHGRI_029351 [Rhododendron griersonianum]